MAEQIIEIRATGFDEAAEYLDLVAARMRNARPVFELIMEFIEKSEQRVFKNLRGKFVDTGALMKSLTEGGENAIRDAHNDMLDFGSSLPYARYQRDPKNPRKSAVLKFLPKERKESSEAALAYILFKEGYS